MCFKEDAGKRKKRLKVVKKKITTTTTRPRRRSPAPATQLSVWAAAEKVKENGPSLRFTSSEESRESEEIMRREDTDDIYRYKPSPTPATKQFYR